MKFKKPASDLLRNRQIRLAAAAAVLAAAYTILFSSGGQAGIYVVLIDGVFTIGLVYLILGMSFYVHNIGLFKTFRYWGYRMAAQRKMKNSAYDARPMDFVAFTQFIMSQPKQPSAVFLISGAAVIAVSALMTVLHGVF